MRLAIFDFDGTVIRGNSWHEFFRSEVRRRPARAPVLLLAGMLRRSRVWSGSRLRAFALSGLRGMAEAGVLALGNELYMRRLAAQVVPEAVAEITARRAAGFEIVIATGAFAFNVAPFARSVGAHAVIATEVEFQDGVCTGRMLWDETLGAAKAAALRERFGDEAAVDWSRSCVYTDSATDAPLLALVGERCFVSADGNPVAGLPENTQCLRWRGLAASEAGAR